MAIFCPKPLRACGMRLTQHADSCGTIVDTTAVPNSQIMTKDFISLSFSPDIEEGETFRLKNACGDLCINDNSDCDKLLGFNLTLQLCGMPIHVMTMLAGMSAVQNVGGDTIGGVLASTNFDSVGSCPDGVAMELWSSNASTDACTVGGTSLPYVRWVLPNTFKWQLSGDTAFANDILNIELSGYAEASTVFSRTDPLDTDMSDDFITALNAGGPLGFFASNAELPTVADCNFTNPA